LIRQAADGAAALVTEERRAETPLTAITADRISQYRAKRLGALRKIGETERRLSASTINRPLALLRHLLYLAHDEWGVLAELPKIRLEKEPQGRLRWLSQDEAAKLLETCRKSRNKALADLVEFSLFTGVRRGEALGLTWDRVDRSRGVIRLEITKSGQRREVPLSSNADAELAVGGQRARRATSSGAETGTPFVRPGRRRSMEPIWTASASTICGIRSRPGWSSGAAP